MYGRKKTVKIVAKFGRDLYFEKWRKKYLLNFDSNAPPLRF